MSLESWKEEFYPVRAVDVKKRDTIGAIKHSILKWEGLKPKNLAKHDMVKSSVLALIREPEGGPAFWADASTCALCQISIKTDGSIDCENKCPIVAATGKRCTESNPRTGMSPWNKFSHTGNTDWMLRVLRKTLKHYEARAAK